MKTELQYYDIFPKVVPAGRISPITVKPLGGHAAFKQGVEYKLTVHPLEEGFPQDYPARRNLFEYAVTPDSDGCIRFSFDFFSEQQYFIRVHGSGKRFPVQLCVYAVGPDLCGRYPFRGDLHMHSSRSDGMESPEFVCAAYRKSGYDFLAITDHRRYYPSLDAIAAYKDAPIEMCLIPGEEVNMPKAPDGYHITDPHIVNFGGEYSINAMLYGEHTNEAGTAPERRSLYGSCPDIMTKEEWWEAIDEYAKQLDIPEGIEPFSYAASRWIFDEIRKANGLGIFCHPYWLMDVYQIPPDFTEYMLKTAPFDAFEVLGGDEYLEKYGLQTTMNNFQAISYYEGLAKGHDYPIVGSTDAHGAVNNPSSHVSSTIVFAPENERISLISSIKGKYTVAVDSISKEPRYVGSLRLVKYACFLDNEFFPLHDELCYEEGRAMRDYVNGEPGTERILESLFGRMKAQREKYFLF